MAHTATLPQTTRGTVFVKRGTRLVVIGCRACGRRSVLTVKDERLIQRLYSRVLRSHQCDEG